jgi:hypothetical protein
MKLSSIEPSVAAGEPLHLHRGVAHDGAHAQPVAPGDAVVAHAVDALLVRLDAVVLRVGAQAGAAAFAEGQRPVELGAREVAVGPGAAHLGIQRIGVEAAAQRHGHQVLHQHVQRLVGAGALLHCGPPGAAWRAAAPRPAPACWWAPASGGWAGPAHARCGPRAAACAPRPWQSRSAARAPPAGSPRPGPATRWRPPRAACPASAPPPPSRAWPCRANRDAARSGPPSRAGASSSSWYQISACERTLVKTSVVPERAISATTGSRMPRPGGRPRCTCPARAGSACRG